MRERVLEEGLDVGEGHGQDVGDLRLVDSTEVDSDGRGIRDGVREYVDGADVAVAVSVGGVAAVATTAALALGVGSEVVVVGVGAVALALLFAGAATGGRVTA